MWCLQFLCCWKLSTAYGRQTIIALFDLEISNHLFSYLWAYLRTKRKANWWEFDVITFLTFFCSNWMSFALSQTTLIFANSVFAVVTLWDLWLWSLQIKQSYQLNYASKLKWKRCFVKLISLKHKDSLFISLIKYILLFYFHTKFLKSLELIKFYIKVSSWRVNNDFTFNFIRDKVLYINR